MWDEILTKYREKFGAASMARVHAMLHESAQQRRNRHPLQRGAQYLLPALGPSVLDIDKYSEIARARDDFKARHPIIRREITAYIEKNGRPEAHAQRSDDKWRVVFLSRLGRREEDVCAQLPETVDYLDTHGALVYPIAGISFSVFEAGAYIAPHSDRTNVFIHLHQGVVDPPDCALKVAGQEIAFEESVSILFDPSYQHEAWNRSRQIRIQLILPVWHPETTLAEREALTEVFGKVRDMVGM